METKTLGMKANVGQTRVRNWIVIDLGLIRIRNRVATQLSGIVLPVLPREVDVIRNNEQLLQQPAMTYPAAHQQSSWSPVP